MGILFASIVVACMYWGIDKALTRKPKDAEAQ
jgi:hypothetical protein